MINPSDQPSLSDASLIDTRGVLRFSSLAPSAPTQLSIKGTSTEMPGWKWYLLAYTEGRQGLHMSNIIQHSRRRTWRYGVEWKT